MTFGIWDTQQTPETIRSRVQTRTPTPEEQAASEAAYKAEKSRRYRISLIMAFRRKQRATA